TEGSELGSAARLVAGLKLGKCFLHGERYLPSSAEILARSAYLGLLGVQNALLTAYFHLRRTERSLYERTARRRRGNGRRVVRHLEMERQRLGRELHTGVGQVLAAIRLQLEIIAAQLPLPEPPVAEALDRISKLAHEASGQVRAL